MKNMVSLIDTNVIINFITQRDDPYKEDCCEVMRLCADEVFDGYIAFHSMSTIWYGLRHFSDRGIIIYGTIWRNRG